MVNGSDSPRELNIKAIQQELNEAVEIDKIIAKKLERMPVSGMMNLAQRAYTAMINAPKCPMFIKSQAESELKDLNDEAELISTIMQRLTILYPDPTKMPEQAKIPMNIVRSIILSRYHKVAKIVTEFHFHGFNEEHGLQIESMLNRLGVERNKSMIEHWEYSKIKVRLVL
jgi:hypothetical protein